jgi:hypothetical protein
MTPTDRENPGTERRQYQKPELRDYGRLAELTRATNPAGVMGDGGMAGVVKSN